MKKNKIKNLSNDYGYWAQKESETKQTQVYLAMQSTGWED